MSGRIFVVLDVGGHGNPFREFFDSIPRHEAKSQPARRSSKRSKPKRKKAKRKIGFAWTPPERRRRKRRAA